MRSRNKFRLCGEVAILLTFALLTSCRRSVVAEAPTNVPPTVAPYCSLGASATTARLGDVLRIRVHAVFPNKFPLNYFWTLDAGTLKGNGVEMLWRPKDAPVGTHIVRARVDDAHGGEANCSVELQVVE